MVSSRGGAVPGITSAACALILAACTSNHGIPRSNVDAGEPAGAPDAPPDVWLDAEPDAAPDAWLDAEPDAAPELPAAFSLDPAHADFGIVAVGDWGTASFRLTNTGDQLGPSLVLSVAATNTSGGFAVDTDACLDPLPGGESCTFTATFQPERGVPSGTLSSAILKVTDLAGNVEATASLVGSSGSPAALAISPVYHYYPEYLSLGVLPVGAPGVVTDFTVLNTGDLPSGTLTTMFGNSPEIAIATDSCQGRVLAGKSSCVVSVMFTPLSMGTFRALLTMTADPGGSDYTRMEAKGLAPETLAINPASATFGLAPTGSIVSYPWPFLEIENGSNVTSGAMTFALGGADATEFSLGALACEGTSLKPLTLCTFELAFAPTSDGPKTATLSVTGDPGGTVTIPLTGTGYTP